MAMSNRSRLTNQLVAGWFLVGPLYLVAHWSSLSTYIQVVANVLLMLLVAGLTLTSGVLFMYWRAQQDKFRDVCFSPSVFLFTLAAGGFCFVVPPPSRADFIFRETDGILVRTLSEGGSCKVLLANVDPESGHTTYRVQPEFADRVNSWPEGNRVHLKLHENYVVEVTSDETVLLSTGEWLEEKRKFGYQLGTVLFVASFVYLLLLPRIPRQSI